MYFEITKCNFFLGKGLPPCNTQKSYTYIHSDQKGPEIWHFSSPIVEFPSTPLQPPNHIHLQI